jgi:hypothetical protein
MVTQKWRIDQVDGVALETLKKAVQYFESSFVISSCLSDEDLPGEAVMITAILNGLVRDITLNACEMSYECMITAILNGLVPMH